MRSFLRSKLLVSILKRVRVTVQILLLSLNNPSSLIREDYLTRTRQCRLRGRSRQSLHLVHLPDADVENLIEFLTEMKLRRDVTLPCYLFVFCRRAPHSTPRIRYEFSSLLQSFTTVLFFMRSKEFSRFQIKVLIRSTEINATMPSWSGGSSTSSNTLSNKSKQAE
jgi:hypothetical protein